MRYEITKVFSNAGTRDEVRMRVVAEFAKELPGSGKGDLASRYIYYVEKLKTGQRIFLTRPAFMHNGFDFVVHVEGVNFACEGCRYRDAPSHEDMLNDLCVKMQEDPFEYSRLFLLLQDVYSCRNVPEEAMHQISFVKGLPSEMTIKVFKWLFIEQEIRYWNYSGRDMLWSGVPRPEINDGKGRM